RQMMAESSRRNAEVIRALGMLDFLGWRYAKVHTKHVDAALVSSESTSGIAAFAKVFRMVLQSGILGLAAYLVIQGEMSGGLMIAASIMMSRALAPIEIAVGNWKGFTSARQGYHRLSHILSVVPAQEQRMPLPAPKQRIVLEDIYVGAPGGQQAIVQAAGLELRAGQGLGLIGPSASGKSTLARAIVGVWPTLRGEIRLDGAAIEQWESDDLGRHIGYLPQDVELFEGTVADNIARLLAPAAEQVVAAAPRACARDDSRAAAGLPVRAGRSRHAALAGPAPAHRAVWRPAAGGA
ncbi:MAG: ATP-binding cassette domain-containing protein, partial [Noviherbaspirillum sp.]